MLAIRLIRIGKKHSSDFRMVVTDKRNPPRGGRFLEVLGHYNPKLKKKGFKEERVKYWLKKGARPSATCHNLLVGAGIIKAEKIKIKISSRKKEKPQELKKEEKVSKTTLESKPEEKTEKKPEAGDKPKEEKFEVKEEEKPKEKKSGEKTEKKEKKSEEKKEEKKKEEKKAEST